MRHRPIIAAAIALFMTHQSVACPLISFKPCHEVHKRHKPSPTARKVKALSIGHKAHEEVLRVHSEALTAQEKRIVDLEAQIKANALAQATIAGTLQKQIAEMKKKR